VKDLVVTESCSTKAACKSVGIARSTYYYRSDRSEDGQLGADLEKLAGQYPKYGTRRITHQLRRAPYSYSISRKRVQRIMRQKRLLRPVKRVKYRTTNSQHPYPRYPNLVMGLEIAQPEKVWVSDITYVRLRRGFVFLAVIMDVFTRAIRGWNLSQSLDGDLALVALQRALSSCIPEIHHD
jgi:putative transposase